MEKEIVTVPAVVINELYEILGLFIPIGLLFACGLMFFFITIPNSPLLSNYRKMRYVMAFAYLLFIPCLVAEYLFRDVSGRDVGVQQVIYLTLSSVQAFLFTLTFLALLEMKRLQWKRVFFMALPVVALVSLVVTVYLFYSKQVFEVAFYLLLVAYAGLLTYYAKLFSTTYKQFRLRMDNYFSDCEAEQMRWIKDSFYVALTVGTVSLLITMFMSILVLLIFSIFFVTFYLYFAIRFVNYAYRFNTIKRAMECRCEVKKENRECCAEAENTQLQIKSTTTHGGANHESTFFPVLEKRIEQWVGEKCFVEQGITMDTLAYEFCTNRSYLSNYINVSKQKTFREWINYLRIEEAKRLLMEYPGKNINEVASEVGIPDKTYFRKHFVTVTGSSPKVWKTANVG